MTCQAHAAAWERVRGPSDQGGPGAPCSLTTAIEDDDAGSHTAGLPR